MSASDVVVWLAWAQLALGSYAMYLGISCELDCRRIQREWKLERELMDSERNVSRVIWDLRPKAGQKGGAA